MWRVLQQPAAEVEQTGSPPRTVDRWNCFDEEPTGFQR
jgi:hypothetical protein